MMHLLLSVIITFCFTICVIVYARPVAAHIGLVDLPSVRKNHNGNIPLIGGLAMMFGIIIGILMLDISLAPYRVLLVSIAIMIFFSMLDDLHELSHKKRFVIQFFVAFIMVHFGHYAIIDLGNFLFWHDIILGSLNLPFTIIAIIAVINAMNMLDGLDGLMGSIALSQFVLLAILAWHVGRFNDTYFIMIIVSAILGFLCFNFPYKKQMQSKIFMGDVGSASLGILISWFLISLSQPPVRAANPVVFLWIMAIPCFDLVSVMLRRLYNKKSPFKADNEHLHHLLKKSGLSDLTTVIVILMISLLFGLAGISMSFAHVSESVMFVILLGCFFGYMFVVNYQELLPRTIGYFIQVSEKS
ncbi:MAG: undecaprenyl/decaprenyl-phosphate alpha-N-acetylglucosaminyl 1-phosphate transferase [Gammaproteobacteria bacterium]|jgi:UDP-GlcNAc:undecaprenyl-phosphate GlcNAc-1-phosphate transferase